MKRLIGLTLALSIAVCLSLPCLAGEADPSAAAFFGKDCETALRKEIGSAKEEIQVAIYSFTRRNISRALAAAAKRGVKVSIKYDAAHYSQLKGMKAVITDLKQKGVECRGIRFGKGMAKMHHKFTVIDRRKVLTGSYNYTTVASTSSFENLVVIESTELAAAFAAEFRRIKGRR